MGNGLGNEGPADRPAAQAEERRQGTRVPDLIEDGAALAQGYAGLALTALAGPAAGVPGGIFVHRVARSLGLAVWRRLDRRQRRRAAGAFEVAVDRAKERIDQGERPRDDGFLGPDEAAPGWELLEGAMIHAANAYRERKVPYIGFLWSSFLFRPDIAPDYADVLLRLANRVSYRQLVALAFFAENAGSRALIDLDTEREMERWPFAQGLARELDELGDQLDLIGIEQRDGSIANPLSTMDAPRIEQQDLARVVLTTVARDLYELMELSRIPEDEKQAIFSLMERSPA
jgi:hypothetical protein